MLNALEEGQGLGLDTVQVFTKNQQQWKAKPLDETVVRDWKRRVAELGWQGRTVSHASYLINLASPDDVLWSKSIDLMEDEIRRCAALEIPYLVHHPGAYTTSTREQGLKRIAAAYGELFTRTRGVRVVSCLENTVGSGSNLGREFGELASLRDLIIERTGTPERLGVCFDTCHAHAGGYDLSSRAKADAALEAFDRACGLEWIRVIHCNDSKGAMGSRRDLHEHIGSGTIGLEGFGAVVNHPAFGNVPKIMETPKGEDAEGIPHDAHNLGRLWRLAGRTPIKQPVSGAGAKGTQPRRKPKAPAKA